jgi:Tol biopolymer transport system component
MEDWGRFSPDGRFVVSSSGGSLMVIDLDGQVVHTISIDDHFAFGPVWSPDGTRIAFSLTTPGAFSADIYTSLPDGTDLQRVTNTPDNEINIDWGVGSE